MLTATESVIKYRDSQAYPDRLNTTSHAHYIELVQKLFGIYTNGIGTTKVQLRNNAYKLFEDIEDCPLGRIAAMIKLLDDVSSYTYPPETKQARMRHWFSQDTTKDVCISKEELFADYPDLRTLESFDKYSSPEDFLSRYNVAQLQSAMYKAEQIELIIRSDFKQIIRNINLSRLLHSITTLPDQGYKLILSGPLSNLHATTRYGSSLSRFIPSLIACRLWELRASIVGPWGINSTLYASSSDGYKSHIQREEEFDSNIEREFALDFAEAGSQWELIREGRLLHNAQKVFIPDFVLRNSSGKEFLLEIAGYWTPEYIEEKNRTLELFNRQDLLVAIPSDSPAAATLPPENIITYKGRLKPEDVLKTIRG